MYVVSIQTYVHSTHTTGVQACTYVHTARRCLLLRGVPAKWALTFLVLNAFFLLASFMSYLVTLEDRFCNNYRHLLLEAARLPSQGVDNLTPHY